MFQVASHPASFNQGTRNHHYPTQAQAPATSLQLPRQLDRPPVSDIPREVIAAANPELANVPAEYIRRGLGPKAPDMLAGIQALSPSHLPKCLPKSRLPDALAIPFLPGASISQLPTHILAVTSSKSHSDQALIFAVHGVVVASHCAQMRLPPSFPPTSSAVRLPVLHINPPSADAFKILLEYMYNHRLDHVLRVLAPLPPAFLQKLSHNAVVHAFQSRSTVYQLASHVYAHENGDLQSIMRHVSHVKDLWQDMIALGIHLPDLWDTIDLAWKILLGALNLATGNS
ncbi:hypothetical protein CPB85DRAFT_1429482 [Mucidula mucida]|nr:hypothetical protein CPB85DRAFT_1429482 [Mucidula mucida]